MSGVQCEVCDTPTSANWLLTRLVPGATFTACEQHLEAALVSLLATRLEVEAGWLTEVINTAVDLVNRSIEEQQEAPTPDQPAKTAARKRRPKKAAAPPAGDESDMVTVPADHDEEYPVVTDE